MGNLLKEHYDLSNGNFDITENLSTSESVEFDNNGRVDTETIGNIRVASTNHDMISFWNEAIKKLIN